MTKMVQQLPSLRKTASEWQCEREAQGTPSSSLMISHEEKWRRAFENIPTAVKGLRKLLHGKAPCGTCAKCKGLYPVHREAGGQYECDYCSETRESGLAFEECSSCGCLWQPGQVDSGGTRQARREALARTCDVGHCSRGKFLVRPGPVTNSSSSAAKRQRRGTGKR